MNPGKEFCKWMFFTHIKSFFFAHFFPLFFTYGLSQKHKNVQDRTSRAAIVELHTRG